MSDSLMPADRRTQVEREEKWSEISLQMPNLYFPKNWGLRCSRLLRGLLLGLSSKKVTRRFRYTPTFTKH